MLKIKKPRRKKLHYVLTFSSLVLFIGGGYLATLVFSPVIAPIITTDYISVDALPAPKKQNNRLVIPKIGVNIPYGENEQSLDRGAQWRHPERGNPSRGGNFIIAAHRFTIQPTPQGTIEKSPFFHVDKLASGDKIIVDYNGKRYAYEVADRFDVKPSQTEIEAPSATPKLTLYTCTLSGDSDGRIVLVSKPLGEVALDSKQRSRVD